MFNYEAKITALEVALYHLETIFDAFPSKVQNIVIFTDSMSALQALECDGYCKPELVEIYHHANKLLTSYEVSIVMQWIPGHSNTSGNDKADRLAKKGAQQEQPYTQTKICTHCAKLKSNR